MNLFPALLTSLDKQEIVTSDFWASQFSSFTPFNVALVLILAVVTGLIISFVYKLTYRGVLYSPQFSMVLIMLTLVTAPVVMAIGSNVALSMGMVGALSIVRFRTAIKEPLDTCYMFWAITMGILLGAQQYVIALVVVIGIGLILILMSYMRFRHPNAYLLVVHYQLSTGERENVEANVEAVLRASSHKYRIRSKTVTRGGAELTVEVRLGNDTKIVGRMLGVNGVQDATLVACQNETGA
ncbi:MAG: DUF4956 domain-containing protein [Clostridia bacterium]|nr:DUF4956 domain-containing protein [Clostridia bacterium]